ncbi:MAG: hemolysin family protein [Nitriliruptoraceae bacterium]
MTNLTAFVAVVALIALNGVFVAAEFALVTVNRPLVEERRAAGSRLAALVSRELSELSFALSVAQFGITATSLLVGFLAEQAVGDTVIRPLLATVGLPEQASLAVTVTGALLLSTLVQVVVGELVPKNLAMAYPYGIAAGLTPFTRSVGLILRPLIRIFDASAIAVARRLFRIDVATELEAGRSLEELSRIIDASGQKGSLSRAQAELLGRAVELGDTRVAEVMVPRPDVAWLQCDMTLEELRSIAKATGFSRFPVYRASEDDVVGTVHLKDLLSVPNERHSTTSVNEVTTPALAVPEAAPLRHLLAELRRDQRTFALVVDEHGGTAGIITVEDVLERLVGDISDEFDVTGPSVRRAGLGRFVVPGSMGVVQVREKLDLDIPDGEYDTIAGFVIEHLGRIPEPGDVVEHHGRQLMVRHMDGMRITEIAIGPVSPRAPDAKGLS